MVGVEGEGGRSLVSSGPGRGDQAGSVRFHGESMLFIPSQEGPRLSLYSLVGCGQRYSFMKGSLNWGGERSGCGFVGGGSGVAKIPGPSEHLFRGLRG